jgi:hypothetical protein
MLGAAMDKRERSRLAQKKFAGSSMGSQPSVEEQDVQYEEDICHRNLALRQLAFAAACREALGCFHTHEEDRNSSNQIFRSDLNSK